MPRQLAPLRSYRTRFFESSREHYPTPPYYGAGWEGHLDYDSGGAGPELVIRARTPLRAQHAAGIFQSLLDAMNLIALTQEVAVVPASSGEMAGLSPTNRNCTARISIAVEGAAGALKLAGVASRRLHIVAALSCLRLSRRACPPGSIVDQPQAIYTQAVIAAYGALECLKVDRSSLAKRRGPTMTDDGSWDDDDTLDNRLRQAGIDRSAEVLWITAGGDQRGKIAPIGRPLSLRDAIYSAAYVRERAGEGSVLAPHDGHNVQSLARALVLGSLGQGHLAAAVPATAAAIPSRGTSAATSL